MSNLPASIFWIVRGLSPTSSAKRSWVSFALIRRRRTLAPRLVSCADLHAAEDTPYQGALPA